MRYVLKQNVLGTSEFKIRNEKGEEIGKIVGSLFNMQQHLTFLDSNHNEYAQIRRYEKPAGLNNETGGWKISRNGSDLVWLQNVTSTSIDARIDTLDGPSFKRNGSRYEYTLTSAGGVAAKVTKDSSLGAMFSLGDTYEIDIADNQDTVLILSIAVVIDLAHEPDQLAQ